MPFVEEAAIPWQQNRPGSAIRTIADYAGDGQPAAERLALIEQICEPGVGAPLHWHDFDEVLQIVEGIAEVWIGEERRVVGPGVSAFMPAGVRHGFRNVGQTRLRLRGAFAAHELVTHFVGHEEQAVRADQPIPWEGATGSPGTAPG